MASKDLFKTPFTDETITKLEIFESYLKEWLPVWIKSQKSKNIYIYDFFSGIGYDCDGIPGSPLRILNILVDFQHMILLEKKKIFVLFNEYKKKYHDQLVINISDFLEQNKKLNYFLEYKIENESFEELYPKKRKELLNGPNLIFLDQNGMKQFNDHNFKDFLKFKKTDFLVFISSSHIKRFGHTSEFSSYLNIKKEIIEKTEYNKIHETIIDYYRSLIPKESTLKLFPFSLKKNQNIHGLIFGAKHLLAVDKFLNIAWKKDKIGGIANFDINEEIVEENNQISLFPEPRKKTKTEKFQEELKAFLLTGSEKNNIETYIFTLQKGFTHHHAIEVLRKLRKTEIDFKGQPKLNYKNYRDFNKNNNSYIPLTYKRIKK
ncbi:three-Cys-motif partner protein TcmP [Zunongwangia sp. HGR-M22]|uniref:three-Cys-motif partner protein TcmP n=1 Tax=Zunongwangia sp. HGR-M22 TaxID=3015168 RepID=UPI0022DDEAA9|nr:three-Cys-motif partner protein TcmP [Zunongwangia sp. HGR-M22]WBL25097.1 three-Cys-motif partner protein TcmP [Zunongwangia sp. HGR-M22]